MVAGGVTEVVGGDFGNLERLRSTWQDRKATTCGPKPARKPVSARRIRAAKGQHRYDAEYLVHMGRSGARPALRPRRRDHRIDRLRLVDEPHPGTPGSFFLSLDPCRYRLSCPVGDGLATDLARSQSHPGLARGHAALATNSGERQPLVALCRDDPGGAVWLGAFWCPHAELFGLVRAVSRSADYFARSGSGPGLGGPPYPVRLCAAGADRHPPRGGAVASLCPA